MQPSILYSGLLAVSFSMLSSAAMFFDHLPNTVKTGEVYDLHWEFNQSYKSVELLLVQQEDFGWKPKKTVFKNRDFPEGDGTYNWTVPHVRGTHALWISGDDPNNANTGYANLTNWFTVEDTDAHHGGLTFSGLVGVISGVVLLLLACSAAALLVWRCRRRSHALNGREVRPRQDYLDSDSTFGRSSFDSIDRAKMEVREVRSV